MIDFGDEPLGGLVGQLSAKTFGDLLADEFDQFDEQAPSIKYRSANALRKVSSESSEAANTVFK